MQKTEGLLILCATPIGNLGDISLRVLDILKNADFIAAEDTRHSLKLLTHYGIQKPLFSCHEHNETEAAAHIADWVRQGKTVALLSDAGMPGISDPGAVVVSLFIKEGLPITLAPGASAVLTAVVLSGLPCNRFVFEGFLPRTKERKERLAGLLHETRTMVLYESPHHLKETLKDLQLHLGNRPIAIVRELTKMHEEVLRLTLDEAVSTCDTRDPRGEYVLVIGGGEAVVPVGNPDESPRAQVQRLMASGQDKKAAIKQTAKERGLPKDEVYRQVTDL